MMVTRKSQLLFLLLGMGAFCSPVFAQETVSADSATWISILPPLFAITLALIFRQVIPALFGGVWLGAWAINGFSLVGLFTGLLDSFQVYILASFAKPDHGSVILFSFMIGGTVGIISRNGGMLGVVNLIVSWANTARRACLATATLGLAVFFDDYANTLVVGNTMRSVTDSMKISRAKLAYIVDSTAAPVSCIALVTTWIGYEVGLIGDATAELPGLNIEPYLLFLSSIPYSFYPIMTIAFVFMVASSGKDFGPMLKAEQAALQRDPEATEHLSSSMATESNAIEAIEGKPQRAINAVLPILVLLLGVVGGLYVTGKAGVEMADPGIKDIIGAANSYTALMWGSMLGMISAAILSMVQRILSLEEVVNSWFEGMRTMFYAMIILVLAWALGGISEQLGTANYLVSILGDTLPVQLVPALVFVLAAGTAFATGSSWGAMGILVPLIVPLTWAVMSTSGHQTPEDFHILYSSIACVLAGSVWGDHCSPISDTTILSSMASGCDHIEHVRTQMPYALLVGFVAIGTCTIPVAYGMPWWMGLLVGTGLLFLVLNLKGETAGHATDSVTPDPSTSR
jgi:Na+/H+ antiporter NhaC